jgi:hypothetical protein
MRGIYLSDFLYLPSNLTQNRKEEVKKKFGIQCLRVEKEVS